MSGRPKQPVKRYSKDGELIKEYDCSRDFIREYYSSDNMRPLWFMHPNVLLLKDGGVIVRNNIPPMEALAIMSDRKRNEWKGRHSLTASSYRSMVGRCNPKGKPNRASKYYLEKGITVCEQWLKSYDTFEAEMGKRPSKNHSIDRIDSTKGYYKENCRWATAKEQANNKSNTVQITMPFTDFIEMVDAPRNVIDYHLGTGKTPKEIFNLLHKKSA